jgi:hypothetical protein
MSDLRHSSDPSNRRTRALVAVAAFSVVALCGTGLAAFSGLLPGSGNVASRVTAMPLVDLQVSASAVGHHRLSGSGRKVVDAAT